MQLYSRQDEPYDSHGPSGADGLFDGNAHRELLLLGDVTNYESLDQDISAILGSAIGGVDNTQQPSPLASNDDIDGLLSNELENFQEIQPPAFADLIKAATPIISAQRYTYESFHNVDAGIDTNTPKNPDPDTLNAATEIANLRISPSNFSFMMTPVTNSFSTYNQGDTTYDLNWLHFCDDSWLMLEASNITGTDFNSSCQQLETIRSYNDLEPILDLPGPSTTGSTNTLIVQDSSDFTSMLGTTERAGFALVSPRTWSCEPVNFVPSLDHSSLPSQGFTGQSSMSVFERPPASVPKISLSHHRYLSILPKPAIASNKLKRADKGKRKRSLSPQMELTHILKKHLFKFSTEMNYGPTPEAEKQSNRITKRAKNGTWRCLRCVIQNKKVTHHYKNIIQANLVMCSAWVDPPANGVKNCS